MSNSVLHLATIFVGLFSTTLAYGCQRTIMRANGVTPQEKQIILDLHNKMRQKVALGYIGGQPPASNMMEITWDDELADRAQWWAETCHVQKHDEARHISRFPVGQNIATTWTTKPPETYEDTDSNFPDAIGKWFNEYRFFSFGGPSRGKTGHYTQMLWAETNKVGCGFAFYYDAVKGFTKNYVCNYGPGGNVIGEKPYRSGYPSCQNFGLVESSNYQGLCLKGRNQNSWSNYYYGISNYIIDRIDKILKK